MLAVNGIISLVAALFCMSTVLSLTLFLSTQNKNTVITAGRLRESSSSSIQDDPNKFLKEDNVTVWEVLWPLMWDVGILFIFILQHSIMASQWWKDTLSSIGIVISQRAIYILATCWALKMTMMDMVQIPLASLWYLDTEQNTLLWFVFFLFHLVAWLLLYATCVIMDVPEMIGCRQVYYQFLGCDPPLMQKSFATRRLYGHMRHGGATCLLVILWVHPQMTAARLVLATMWTWYLMWGFSVCGQDYIYLREQISRKHLTITTARVRTVNYRTPTLELLQ